MNRILEFTPSQEEAVVSRILVLVHQAVDDHFPAAGHANRQFTKTVFSDEGEPTAALRVASDEAGARSSFGSSEDTSPIGRPMEASGAAASSSSPVPPAPVVLPPPPPHKMPTREESSRGGRPEPPRPGPAPAEVVTKESGQSRATGLESTMQGIKSAGTPDWVTRITLALLLAGLVLLAYVLFA